MTCQKNLIYTLFDSISHSVLIWASPKILFKEDNMKRFISILVAVMMVLTLLPLGRVFAEEEEEVTKQEEKVMEVPGEGEKAPGEGGETAPSK